MSEHMPEGAPRAPAGPPAHRGGSGFTARWGPLPVWAWLGLLAVVVVGGTLIWRKSSSSSGSPQNVAPGTSTGATSNPNTVPQFVNQTYTTVTAPEQTTVNLPPDDDHPQYKPPQTHPMIPGGPEPTTVSGAPGSYTTGLKGGTLDEWTSTGKYSLNVLAKSHGMTAQQLVQSSLAAQNNPGLQAYVKAGNFNKPVPAGVELFYPADKWATTGSKSGTPKKT